jgi:hypothetical protein
MSIHEDNKHVTRRAVPGSRGVGAAVALSQGVTGAADEPAKGTTSAPAGTRKTRIGKLRYEAGVPTADTVQKLYDELDFQRAVLAYQYAEPLVSFNEMNVGLKDGVGGREGDCTSFSASSIRTASP